MNGPANVKCWDAVGNGVVRTFPGRPQHQPLKCQGRCALGTVLDADCGLGTGDSRVQGGGGRKEIGEV